MVKKERDRGKLLFILTGKSLSFNRDLININKKQEETRFTQETFYLGTKVRIRQNPNQIIICLFFFSIET